MSQFISLTLKSSTPGNTYDLTVHTAPDVRLACSCPASDQGMLCKHVLAVASGDDSLLAGRDPGAWRAAQALIAASHIPARLSEWRAKNKAIDTQLAELKKAQSGLKRALARDLLGFAP